MSQFATVDIIVGALRVSQIRDFLKKKSFLGEKIEWIEGSGFFQRTFTVKGDVESVKKVAHEICQLAGEGSQ